MIWILEFDNGEGGTWMNIFGTKKECLKEAEQDFYQTRYPDWKSLLHGVINHTTETGDYTIFKTEHYYTGA